MTGLVKVDPGSDLPDGWRPLTRAQQAAAVVLAVGPEHANGVLDRMPEADVERIALEVATLGDVHPDQVLWILESFHTEAQAHRHLIQGGEEHARELLRHWRGGDAEDVIDRLLATVRTSPFQFLRLHPPQEIVQHLQDEHPQTLALVLAHLPTRLGAQILAALEPGLQGEVALRVATMEVTAPEVVARVEDALQARLGTRSPVDETRQGGGARDLANMLNSSDRDTEQAVLGSIEAADPDLAEEVRNLMFVFEDITTLEDRAVQEVMRQVEPTQLAVALKGVGDDTRDVVLRNLSERAREALTEEIDLLGPTRLRDVEAAQTEIVRTIRGLEAAGQIVVRRGDDEELV